MTNGYTVHHPSEELIEALAANPNPKDEQEVRDIYCMSFKRALRRSIEGSPEPFVIVGSAGQPLAAIGVSQACVLDDHGSPWMLGSAEVPKHKKALLRFSRDWVEYQKTKYERLENIVPADYPEAIRWLKWLGFAILPPEPLQNGVLAHRVLWEK